MRSKKKHVCFIGSKKYISQCLKEYFQLMKNKINNRMELCILKKLQIYSYGFIKIVYNINTTENHNLLKKIWI